MANEMKILERILSPLKRRVMLMIGRAVLSAADDSKGIQVVKIDLLADETKEDVERFQNYGLTSVPLDGAEATCLFVGGDRDHGIVVNIDDRRFRLKGLEKGEVALYTDEGDKLHFKRGNILEIETKELTINCENSVVNSTIKSVVDSPLIELGSGALESTLNGQSFQTLFNTHVHVGNMGAPTAPPTTPSTPADLSTKVKAAK